MAVAKDQSKYVFSSKEGRIAICDAETKRLLVDKDMKESSIWTLALYCNDSIVLSAGSGKIIRKIQLDTLKEIDALEGHTGEVNYVVVSPDEKWAYSGSDDTSVRKWDLTTSKPNGIVLYNHQRQVFGMGLSFDGSLLSTVSEDGMLIVYREAQGLKDSNTVIRKLKINDQSL